MMSIINKIKKLSYVAIFLIGCIIAKESKDMITIPIDFSVYNGEGSILINWSIPDSIKVKSTIIYSQQFGKEEFKEIATLPSETFFFLDTNCESKARYFYKIIINDIHDKSFIADSSNIPFGSCESISENVLINKNIKSLNNLFVEYIKNKLLPIETGINYNYLLEFLLTNEINNYNWIENFPSTELKALYETIDKTNEIISDPNFYNEIANYENLYRNYLFLTPKIWHEQVIKTISTIKSNWDILYENYAVATDQLNNLEPIRIVALENNLIDNPKIILNVFHADKILSKEWYLLSGEEYINLEKFLVSKVYNFSVEIPKHWNYVSLMANDLFVQTLPILQGESCFYTLDGDIIPCKNKNKNLIKLKREMTSLWFNELIWNAELMALHIEVAGHPKLDESYLIKVGNEIIWNVDPDPSFSTQYIDSLIKFESGFDFPSTLKLQSLNDSLTTTHEYIILDTISKSMARLNDEGPWEFAKSSTIGLTNKTNKNNYDSPLVPQLFVLYQNYPNPFNGQTKITFDLFEDAQVSLYITDAKGRVQEKILEKEFHNSGIYNFLWEAENLSSGVYFITLQAEVDRFPAAILSRKMIYLK